MERLKLIGAALLIGCLAVSPTRAEDLEGIEDDLALTSVTPVTGPAINANVQTDPNGLVPTAATNTAPAAPQSSSYYGLSGRDNAYTDALDENLRARYYQVDQALGALASKYPDLGSRQQVLVIQADGKNRFHYYSWNQDSNSTRSLQQWVTAYEQYLQRMGQLYPQNYLQYRNYYPYNQYSYNPWNQYYTQASYQRYQPYYYPNYTRYRVTARIYTGYYGPQYYNYNTYSYSNPGVSLSLGVANGLSLSLGGY